MSLVPTAFPALCGSYALLRLLSDEGERSVYLVAINGASKPWVMKTMSLPGQAAFDLDSLNVETQSLCRMRSANLAKLLDAEEIGGDLGVVMEHVPGKPLGAICRRADGLSALLPTKLGLVIAHDVFAALDAFHDFEGAGRVHGNVSPRTILVGYSGDVKLAGYRPGFHPRSEADVLVAKDLVALASILCDLPFRRFPQELAQLVPRLLEEAISPAEALAAVKAFLAVRVPSAKDRQEVASWLEEIFPGEYEKDAQDGECLLAAGIDLLVRLSPEQKGWAQNPVIGERVGEYTILKILGEGGMGCVYEAEHGQAANHVALKVLHPKGRTSEIEERFRREAEAILRIADNPHAVRIEGFGSSDDGKFLYLSMELLRGVSLDRAIAKEGPFDPRRALRIASQICQALVAAHGAGVIHRDLKPGNVMLVNKDGRADFVKVLDFGLARLDMAEAVLTRVGDLIGTFAYMAPEQAQGKPATPKIDIYALGELLYEMLTGRLPHEGSDDILARKATTDPTPITQHRPDIPEAISRLVMKALARDPEERHATMAELGWEIDDVLAPLDTSVFRLSRFKLLATGIVGTLAIAGVAALFVGSRRQQAILETKPREAALAPSPAQAIPDLPSQPPPPSDPTGPVPARPVVPPLPHPEAKPEPPAHRAPKRKAQGSPAEQLLREADAAFEGGNHIEAIKLGTQALNAGGGVAAHLALAGYYRSMSRYRDAMQHYRAADRLDPGNAVAAAGIRVVEKQIAPSP